MKSLRKLPYKENPKTLSEHLRKRRLQLGLLQREAAVRLGVSEFTYHGWERRHRSPPISTWPKIIQFLGYDPLARPLTLGGQIAARRRELGLSMEKAAQLIGLDEGSLRRYELQQRLPRGQQLLKVQRFISPGSPSGR